MGWIYLLTDNISDKCYIGKTCIGLKQRLSSHFSDARKKKRNSYKDNWIRSVWSKGGEISIKEITSVPDDILDETEILHIRLARQVGLNLTNYSDGGDGFKRGNQYGKISKKNIILKRTIINCKECGKEKLVNNCEIRKGSGKFCSLSCRTIYNNKNNKEMQKKSAESRIGQKGILGESNPNARLTNSQVKQIRDIYYSTENKYGLIKALAEKYSVGRWIIDRVIRYKSYR